ncbi:MAG: DUF1501 domain-containing protein, partial [Phycisphaerales bacterium JB039]
MDPRLDMMRDVTRRHFLGQAAMGVGSIALGSLLARAAGAAPPAPAAGVPHFAQRAKRVIYLHMAGSPPQLDLLDPKPMLNRMHGQDAPDELYKGDRFAFIKGTPTILGSPYQFRQRGKAGLWVSELMPRFAEIADE